MVVYKSFPQTNCFDCTDLGAESRLNKQSTNGSHVALPCVSDPAKPTVHAVGDYISQFRPAVQMQDYLLYVFASIKRMQVWRFNGNLHFMVCTNTHKNTHTRSLWIL